MDVDDPSNAHIQDARDITNSLHNIVTGDEIEIQSIKRQRTTRDPMSHRIIEKRRRDRMNNCLADLSRLIPTSYLKQGQGRIEKTEIIEMAIKHIKTLQAQVDGDHCQGTITMKSLQDAGTNSEVSKSLECAYCQERFHQGFKECQDEILRYFVQKKVTEASDPFCVCIMEHLSAVARSFGPPSTLTDKKPGSQREQKMHQGGDLTDSLNSLFPSTLSSSQNPILPVLPEAAGKMVSGSQEADKHSQCLQTTRPLNQLEAEEKIVVSKHVNEVINNNSAFLTCPPQRTIALTQLRSALSTYSSSNNEVRMSNGAKNSDHSLNAGISSGYVSDISTIDQFPNDSLMNTGTSEMNIYKFKHNITKRFSQEGKFTLYSNDGSSSTSSRDADEDLHHCGPVRHRAQKSKCHHTSSSDSGPYPLSEFSGATSSSSHDSVEINFDRSLGNKCTSRSTSVTDHVVLATDCSRHSSSVPLPGFILHPSGTHYMPISVCNTKPEVFNTGMERSLSPLVFHPISIPVHFRGPVISLPGSTHCYQYSSAKAPFTTVKNMSSVSQNCNGGKGL